jgi:RNA polymerase sigma-70 factor (ECF subfamily)
MTDEPTDRVLLDQIRRGNERAFEELFARHFSGIYGVVVRIVGNHEEAEEIAHDAFLKLYQRPLGDSDDLNVRGWLYRVATNAGFNAIRSRRRRRNWFQRLAQRAESRQSGSDPLDIVSAEDESQRVRDELLKLPERQRTALLLRASGLTYEEIAAAVGVSPTSVGTILARAERAFRTQYTDTYGVSDNGYGGSHAG